jgi:hypothetical protein
MDDRDIAHEDVAGLVLGALDPVSQSVPRRHVFILIRPAKFARHERGVMTRSAAWPCS